MTPTDEHNQADDTTAPDMSVTLSDGLTLKQALFVAYYLGVAHGNGVKAARLAGYGGSDQTLRSIASENLAKPYIASRVRAHVDAVALSADEVLIELTEVAMMDVKSFIGMGKDAKATLGDKVRALELLGKYHKLWIDRAEVTNKEVKRIEIRSIEVAQPE